MIHCVEVVAEGENIELRGDGSGDYIVHLTADEHDGQPCIGHIEGSHTTLSDIHLDPDYRGNGYGRETLELYIEQAKQANCDSMQTTAVLHGAVGYVLRDNGFTPSEDNIPNDGVRYTKQFD